MSEDVVLRTTTHVPALTWDHVVTDSAVGLIDLDGHGTSALMNDAARELLQLLRASADGAAVVGPQAGASDVADADDTSAGEVVDEDPVPTHGATPVESRRGPLSVRGDLTEILWRYAPGLVETIRREGRPGGRAQRSGPAGAVAPSRVVSCSSPQGQRWVRIDGYRRSGNRFLVTLVDVTSIEREATSDGARAWELADTVAQRLVTAETALDLGRDELGRRLVAEARALIRARIGEHLHQSGGPGPGLMRRRATPPDASPPTSGPGL